MNIVPAMHSGIDFSWIQLPILILMHRLKTFTIISFPCGLLIYFATIDIYKLPKTIQLVNKIIAISSEIIITD